MMLRLQATTFWVLGAILFMPALAHAHFVLVKPASWMSQTSSGDPQKRGPCGDEGGGTPTGKITEFRPGETIGIEINEVIFHPGHYRVALAVRSRSELPKDPRVTPGSTPCGTADIQNPPVFPVLGDNLLAHTTRFTGPQSMQVTLPKDVTCTKCTLQVLEFMSEHEPNCFYYHCADIAIQGSPVDGDAGVRDAGGGTSDSGAGGSDGSDDEPYAPSSGGCSMPPGEAPAASVFAGLFMLTMWIRRRRRTG